mgnify:CR=1 FL=1
MQRILILDKHEVGVLIFDSGKFNPATPAIGCLFGGDRFGCIDEAVVLEVDGEIVGLATIAPRGEERSGQPTIVGLYARHEWRGNGYGYRLMMAAIDRMRERGLPKPYRADAISSPGFRVCQGLPEEYQVDLDICDMSMDGMLDIVMLI